MPPPETELDATMRASVLPVIEDYFAALDSRDAERIAACFTGDADIRHRDGAQRFSSGREVAEAVLAALHDYPVSRHELVGLDVRRTGQSVAARYAALVFLVDARAIRVRGVDYDDELREQDGAFRIAVRRHRPRWETVLRSNL